MQKGGVRTVQTRLSNTGDLVVLRSENKEAPESPGPRTEEEELTAESVDDLVKLSSSLLIMSWPMSRVMSPEQMTMSTEHSFQLAEMTVVNISSNPVIRTPKGKAGALDAA